ncbi:MAG TPA: glycosyltransferase family 2 protein [Candidatus Saccharimonadales bacterium]|nr:glycosyltransferase family 2 protein [Candidatus Saccharimonadales bacterium]
MDLSIVSWIHNCEDTIEELYTRVSNTMDLIGSSYEIILINDGSTDNSWDIIKDLHKKDPHVKAINFSRYYGHSAGLQAGFDAAKGDLVFTISPTLENAPEELPKFIEEMRSHNYDMIVGCRKHKAKGKKVRGLVSKIANKMISLAAGHQITDMTSPYRLIKKSVLSNLRLYGDHYMFLPALASLYGARFGEIDIEHSKPKNKSYKNVHMRLIPTALDIVVLKFLVSFSTPPFSTAPIRVFGGTGIVSLLIGLVLGIYLSVDKLLFGHSIGNRPLLLLSILMVMLGAMFVLMGLLGELLVRIYFEGQNKMTYHIREVFK